MNTHTERVYPIIKGWTSESLRKREDLELANGGFGNGCIIDGPRIGEVLYPDPPKEEGAENVPGGEGPGVGGTSDSVPDVEELNV